MYKNRRMPIKNSVRFDVLRRDNFTCRYCGAQAGPGVVLHIDHVFPVAHGGTNEFGNLVTCCQQCNSGKSCVPLGERNTETIHNSKKESQQLIEYLNRLLSVRFNRIVCAKMYPYVESGVYFGGRNFSGMLTKLIMHLAGDGEKFLFSIKILVSEFEEPELWAECCEEEK